MGLSIDGFDRAQAVADEHNAVMTVSFQKLKPGGDVVPAVIDGFICRAKAAADIADAGAIDRVMAAGVDRENREAELLQPGNERLEGARGVEVAGYAVEKNGG